MKENPRYLPDGTVCCGNGPWRHELCAYHAGWDDGAEALLDMIPDGRVRFGGEWYQLDPLSNPDLGLESDAMRSTG